jgi:ADP-ribose pyrophosphatase
VPEATFDRATSIFRSERFSLLRETFLTSDGEVVRPVIHHPGAVGIIALTAQHELVLVRQYRYPIRRWTLEIPAGTRVVGEPAAVTAARELQEEAGYVATRMEEIMRFFPAVGVSDEELILFRAHGLSDVPAAPEHGELVERVVMPLDHVAQHIATGLICDAKTLMALALLGRDARKGFAP